MLEKLKHFSFKKIFTEIFLANSDSPNKVASALSLGVFIAVIPIYGFQSLAAVGLSHILKLNKAIVFTATNISWPPMVFGLIYASYQTGYFLFNGSFNAELGMSSELVDVNSLGENLYIFVIGSIIFGLLLSAFVWTTTRFMLLIVKKN
jgi:uncharacterized protein (DUF2062 family)